MSKLVLPFLILLMTDFSSSLAEIEGSSWDSWLPISSTRELYFTLAVIIIACYIYSVVRDERETDYRREESMKALFISQKQVDDPPVTLAASYYAESESQDLLREANARNEAMKMELAQLSKIRESLEERSRTLEVERDDVEVRLERTMELSERLSKECGKGPWELAVAEPAAPAEAGDTNGPLLADHAILVERLEAARREVASLRASLDGLREERARVMAVAAEVAGRCQGLAGESAAAARQYVLHEMSRLGRSHESVQLQTSEPPSAVSLHQPQEEPPSTAREDCVLCQKASEETGVRLGTVTGSSAFRDFLFGALTED